MPDFIPIIKGDKTEICIQGPDGLYEVQKTVEHLLAVQIGEEDQVVQGAQCIRFSYAHHIEGQEGPTKGPGYETHYLSMKKLPQGKQLEDLPGMKFNPGTGKFSHAKKSK